MKRSTIFLMLLAGWSVAISCKTVQYFDDKERHISNLPSLPVDSADFFAPDFSLWMFAEEIWWTRTLPPNNENHPMLGFRRPDSVRIFLTEKLGKYVPREDLFLKSGDCMLKDEGTAAERKEGKNLNAESIYQGKRDILDMKNFACLDIDPARYSVLFLFLMSWNQYDQTNTSGGVNRNADGAGQITAFCLVLHQGEIRYYRKFTSIGTGRRDEFPMGHPDRIRFPYLPPQQLRTAVDSITGDLIRRMR